MNSKTGKLRRSGKPALQSRLHASLEEGHLHQFRLLVSAGAALEVRDEEGRTPFLKVCGLSNLKSSLVLAQLLLLHGADPTVEDIHRRTGLWYACQAGHYQLVMLLLDTEEMDLGKADAAGITPLHLAAVAGYINILCSLIHLMKRGGITVDSRDLNGVTPLMAACRMGQVTSANLLVQSAGASLTMRDNIFFRSPKEWLQASGHGHRTAEVFGKGVSLSEDVCNSVQFRKQLNHRTVKSPGIHRTEVTSPKMYRRSKSAKALRHTSLPIQEEIEELSVRSGTGDESRKTLLTLFELYSHQSCKSQTPAAKPQRVLPPFTSCMKDTSAHIVSLRSGFAQARSHSRQASEHSADLLATSFMMRGRKARRDSIAESIASSKCSVKNLNEGSSGRGTPRDVTPRVHTRRRGSAANQ